MPERPLLILPTPDRIAPPVGRGGRGNLRFPKKARQVATFGPEFRRLRDLLSRPGGPIQLHNDPTALSPDRVIVFEVAGTVADFVRALGGIPGLEFMAEQESEFAADADFAALDTRKGREGTDREGKPVGGRLYMAMPDTAALNQLVRLWDRWENNQPLGIGFAPFVHLFEQLHALRPWGPLDRIPDETIAYWREEAAQHPDRSVRTEVELWFRGATARQLSASSALNSAVTDLGGRIVDEAVIAEIAYHGALIDVPVAAIGDLIARQPVGLVLADEVMFLRPQGMLSGPLEVEPGPDAALQNRAGQAQELPPIAALLDGVPLQEHALLRNRISLDDPEDLQARAIVAKRVHGTAMASLIVHGDLNAGERPLPRPLHVRPLMLTTAAGDERTDADRLVVDTVYRAIVRMKGAENQQPTAGLVFLVNLSMADSRRPFTGLVSPFARLLDFLSDRYGILFLVSAGNVTGNLHIEDYNSWLELERSNPRDRERAVLRAINRAKFERTILSPAESLNAITVGAQHHDNVAARGPAPNAIDPYQDNTLPNVTSGLGLGYRRAIKPEIYLPAGREHLRLANVGHGITVRASAPQRVFGVSAAAPDPGGAGRLNYTALSSGTSSATALATRAAHRIFDALMDRDGGSALADIDPRYYAVVVKALLIHRARWNGNGDVLKDICGPEDKRQHVERAENACRFIGFGVPNIAESMECSPQRATLVGFGDLPSDHAHRYRVPLPSCLERVTDPRSLTVTLAWFSPVRVGHQSYRGFKLDAAPLPAPLESLGVKRAKLQPADATVKRGTIFQEHFYGEAAVPFIDDGNLSLHVWCKEDAGGAEEPIRYGIAVTIEAHTPIPVYQQVRDRLRVRPRPPA